MPCKWCATVLDEPVPPVTKREVSELVDLAGLAEILRNKDRDSRVVAELALALYYFRAAQAFSPGSAIRGILEKQFDKHIGLFADSKALGTFRSGFPER